MTKQVETKKQIEDIRIVYNDDSKVIDFLSDLQDREPIRMLQRYVNYSSKGTACLLTNCKEDHLFVLLLYRAPFPINQGDNNLLVYAHSDLKELIKIFQSMGDRAENEEPINKELLAALDDILALLWYHKQIIEDNEVQGDYLG